MFICTEKSNNVWLYAEAHFISVAWKRTHNISAVCLYTLSTELTWILPLTLDSHIIHTVTSVLVICEQRWTFWWWQVSFQPTLWDNTIQMPVASCVLQRTAPERTPGALFQLQHPLVMAGATGSPGWAGSAPKPPYTTAAEQRAELTSHSFISVLGGRSRVHIQALISQDSDAWCRWVSAAQRTVFP